MCWLNRKSRGCHDNYVLLLRDRLGISLMARKNLCKATTESGPLSLGMQHHYFARYPTDEWHLANVFSLVYFSVVVCLRGLYHHILLATARALCQGQCTPHARFPLTKGGGLISGSPLLGRTGGVVELVLGSVFIIELNTGLVGIYFHRYYTEYDVCHKQNT